MENFYPRQENKFLSSVSQEELDIIRQDIPKFIDAYFFDCDIRILDLIIDETNVNNVYELHTINGRSIPGGYSDKLLIYAIIAERVDLVRFLLSKGADRNTISHGSDQVYIDYSDHESSGFGGKIRHFYETALMVACKFKSPDIVLELLNNDADVNLVPEQDYIFLQGYNEEDGSLEEEQLINKSRHPVTIALLYGNYEYVQYLMAHGADQNFDNGTMESTPLYGLITWAIRGSVMKYGGLNRNNEQSRDKNLLPQDKNRLRLMEDFLRYINPNTPYGYISYALSIYGWIGHGISPYSERSSKYIFQVILMLIEYCFDVTMPYEYKGEDMTPLAMAEVESVDKILLLLLISKPSLIDELDEVYENAYDEDWVADQVKAFNKADFRL